MTKCKLCSGDNANKIFLAKNIHGRHLLSEDSFDICRCHDCGVSFVDVDIDDDFYAKYYPKGYYPQDKYPRWISKTLLFLRNLTFDRRISFIKKYCPQAKNILEVGCAKGEFLSYLSNCFNKSGIEINPEGYQHVQKNCPDIRISNIRLDSSEAQIQDCGLYDVVAMWHVLEHIENPNIFIKNISKILAKDGIFIFEIPNGRSLGFKLMKSRWFHLDAPRHFFHYDYSSIEKLVNRHNFEIVGFRGDFLGYFQDLASSFYGLVQNKNFLFKIVTILAIIPVLLIVRFFAALCFPR